MSATGEIYAVPQLISRGTETGQTAVNILIQPKSQLLFPMTSLLFPLLTNRTQALRSTEVPKRWWFFKCILIK